MEECRLQYQFTLKKKEEQDEQRQIKEQIREEQRAIKEYEKAIADAEKEEKLYRNLLEKARKHLESANDEERLIAQQKIEVLELQLAEAEAKEQRAKSMAEQTRKGHVYVISNIGSFGENVYKIGLTRRLEPMDRVKELGDASVPFSFDVHAMIYVEDAPALESALHREFTHKRVNAVNLRKEFFTTDLDSIKNAVNKIAGVDAEFNTTVLAQEYYESKRLSAAS
jgi:predicted RNase H-like nuclease (RuvC/YqgF family)